MFILAFFKPSSALHARFAMLFTPNARGQN
jgi:hypothetical protein